MISYSLKQILSLIPEAFPFVKQASVQDEFPLNSKDSAIASALRIEHDIHFKHRPVDPEVMEKVAMAVEAYGVEQTVSDLKEKMHARHFSTGMEKAASTATPEGCMVKMASLEGELTGFKDLESLSKKAEEILEQCNQLGVEPSDTVRRYAADAYLSKEAALGSLNARYHLTKDPLFVKLAAALGKEEALIPSGEMVRGLCQTITRLDKKAHLDIKGFDFYREALLVKSAAVTAARVKLDQNEYPLESVLKIPRHHLASYLGEEIAQGLSSDPVTAKAVVESLPLDLQRVLVTLMKNA